MGPSHPGQLIDPAGIRTRAPVAWDFWSNPRGLGHRTASPGNTDQHRGPLLTVPSLP